MESKNSVIDCAVIDTAVRTSLACPEQCEGTLTNGQKFYFRYRGGVVSLGLGSTIEEAIDASFSNKMEYGEPLQGWFVDKEERSSIFNKLLIQWIQKADDNE
jgi:hypothetical protein